MPTQLESLKRWNFWVVGVALVLGFLFQVGTLPIAFHSSHSAEWVWRDAQWGAALLFDLFVLVRLVVARLARERSYAWIALSVLCLAAPLWIPAVFKLVWMIHES